MLVFNLTSTPIIYKNRTIPPDGGSLDYPDLDFIPDRDRKLEQKRVLAFGSLPRWFVLEKEMREAERSKAPQKKASVGIEVREKIEVGSRAEAKVEEEDKPEAKTEAKSIFSGSGNKKNR